MTILLLVAATAWCMGIVWITAPSLVRGHSRANFDLSGDPRIGSTVGMTGKDIHGRFLPGKEKIILVVAASCSSCQSKSLDNVALFRGAKLPVIIAFPDNTEDLRTYFPKPSPKTFIISDRGGSISSRLNVLWNPRMFIIEHGKLVRIQREPRQSLSEFLK